MVSSAFSFICVCFAFVLALRLPFFSFGLTFFGAGAKSEECRAERKEQKILTKPILLLFFLLSLTPPHFLRTKKIMETENEIVVAENEVAETESKEEVAETESNEVADVEPAAKTYRIFNEVVPEGPPKSWYSDWILEEKEEQFKTKTLHMIRTLDVYTYFCESCESLECVHEQIITAEVERQMEIFMAEKEAEEENKAGKKRKVYDVDEE